MPPGIIRHWATERSIPGNKISLWIIWFMSNLYWPQFDGGNRIWCHSDVYELCESALWTERKHNNTIQIVITEYLFVHAKCIGVAQIGSNIFK